MNANHQYYENVLRVGTKNYESRLQTPKEETDGMALHQRRQ